MRVENIKCQSFTAYKKLKGRRSEIRMLEGPASLGWDGSGLTRGLRCLSVNLRLGQGLLQRCRTGALGAPNRALWWERDTGCPQGAPEPEKLAFPSLGQGQGCLGPGLLEGLSRRMCCCFWLTWAPWWLVIDSEARFKFLILWISLNDLPRRVGRCPGCLRCEGRVLAGQCGPGPGSPVGSVP